MLPLLLLALPWSCQDTGYVISTNVDLVILDASVKNSKGENVSGLAKDDFRIFDDNKPQTIQYFSRADMPVTIGLVVDNSGSMSPKRAEVAAAALALIKASNPHDEVFVVNFNDSVRFGLPPDVAFTDDLDMLSAALMQGRSKGRTALYDAISQSLEHLDRGHMGKKALVIISDGGDNASALNWDGALARVEKSRATLHTIDIFDENDPDRHPGILKKLAQISGGDYFQVRELPEIGAACETIGADIRNRYTLAYLPSHVESQAPIHTIKVIASSPAHGHLTVRARQRYIAPGPKGSGQ